jgi:hypothetical protein
MLLFMMVTFGENKQLNKDYITQRIIARLCVLYYVVIVSNLRHAKERKKIEKKKTI